MNLSYTVTGINSYIEYIIMECINKFTSSPESNIVNI